MPFKKAGPDHYISPTGRSYNGAQVRLYYANGGKFPGEKRAAAEARKPNSVSAKPNSAKGLNYAAGLRR